MNASYPGYLNGVIAANIRAERARCRMSQEDIAGYMRNLGWKWVRQTIGVIENAERRVTAAELIALAGIFGVPITTLTSTPTITTSNHERNTQ